MADQLVEFAGLRIVEIADGVVCTKSLILRGGGRRLVAGGYRERLERLIVVSSISSVPAVPVDQQRRRLTQAAPIFQLQPSCRHTCRHATPTVSASPVAAGVGAASRYPVSSSSRILCSVTR